VPGKLSVVASSILTTRPCNAPSGMTHASAAAALARNAATKSGSDSRARVWQVGAVRRVHRALAGEHEAGPKLRDDVPATGVDWEHLPEKPQPRAAHRAGPLARAGGRERGEADEERPKEVLDPLEGAAAQFGGVNGGERVAGLGRQPRAPSLETGGGDIGR
jgi:hypothetical protein